MAEPTNDQKFAATLARLDTKKKTMDEARLAALPSERQKDQTFFDQARARSGPYNQTGGGSTSDRADKATLTARLRSYSDPNSPLRQVLTGLKEEEAKAAAGLAGAGGLAGAAENKPNSSAGAAIGVQRGEPAYGSVPVESVKQNLSTVTGPDNLKLSTPETAKAPSFEIPAFGTAGTTTGASAAKPIPLQGGSPEDMTTSTPTPVVPSVPGAQASFFGKPLTDEEKARQSVLNRVTGKV